MPTVRTYLAGAVFLAALFLIMTRPRRVPEAASALGGGALMVALGVVDPREAADLLLDSWNILLFFLGLMLISALADQAGVFEWLALWVARRASGSARLLLVLIFGLGTVLTAFFSNDATALILSPVVYALVLRLGLPARPYAYACTFIADTASFLLPVSNPINVLVLETFPIPLGAYLRHLLPAAIAAIAVNVLLFLILFRADLRLSFEPKRLTGSEQAPGQSSFFRWAVACLSVLAPAYVAASARQWPLSLVALAGGLALLAGAVAYGQLDARRLRGEISWPLFPFVAGLLLLVRGIENIGLAGHLADALVSVAGIDPLQVTLAGVFGAGLGTNLTNNVPAALVLTSALAHVPDGPVRQDLVYGVLVGVDVGPNLTTVGSLATMLWLLLLRRRGLEVSSWEYFKIGVLVTPPMLLAAAGALWLTGGR